MQGAEPIVMGATSAQSAAAIACRMRVSLNFPEIVCLADVNISRALMQVWMPQISLVDTLLTD